MCGDGCTRSGYYRFCIFCPNNYDDEIKVNYYIETDVWLVVSLNSRTFVLKSFTKTNTNRIIPISEDYSFPKDIGEIVYDVESIIALCKKLIDKVNNLKAFI
jgi:hypothetical protein